MSLFFLEVSKADIFVWGGGSAGRDTDPVTKWCWWRGRHKKRSYSLSCGSHSRVGLGVSRVPPTQAEVRPQAELELGGRKVCGDVVSESPIPVV